jgi:hypothetical protein
MSQASLSGSASIRARLNPEDDLETLLNRVRIRYEQALRESREPARMCRKRFMNEMVNELGREWFADVRRRRAVTREIALVEAWFDLEAAEHGVVRHAHTEKGTPDI